MSDIRRLNIQEKPAASVSAVSMENYKLGPERLHALEEMLPELLKCAYWSPEYQAWEPFITTYLRSGVHPQLAGRWLKDFSAKIEELGPKKTKFHGIYAEILRMNKTASSEVFEDYDWDDIMEFVNWIPVYIDNTKTILKFLFDQDNYNTLLSNLLSLHDDESYSTNLPYAAYLYRHCMFEFPPYTPLAQEMMESQLLAYCNDFEKAFTVVASFIGDISGVYAWYSPKIRKLICNSWKTTMDLTDKRKIISANDVFNMPVWLSEQATDYLTTLPCTYTVPVTGTFIIDALEYALSKEASFESKEMMYAFCIPKDYVRKFFEQLSVFYWDVKEGRFVEQLRALVSAQSSKNSEQEFKSLAEYDEELRVRGFPLQGGNNEEG